VVLVLVCVPLAEPTMTAMDIVTTKMLIALMAVAANVPPVLVVIRLLAASLLEYVAHQLVPVMSPNLVLVQTRLVQVILTSQPQLFVLLVRLILRLLGLVRDLRLVINALVQAIPAVLVMVAQKMPQSLAMSGMVVLGQPLHVLIIVVLAAVIVPGIPIKMTNMVVILPALAILVL